MNGVIWSKTQQTFIPISSIPIYAKMQQERFKQSRAFETHNFQLQNLTLTSFNDPHFLEFYDNDTKVSGLYGEIWNLLSESLNFTLQPVRTNINSLGVLENYTYKQGLLGIISRNETIAIPKIEMIATRLAACDFTIPFWFNRNYLYIRTEDTLMYDSTWMLKIFSWNIWIVILMMCILLSVCTFLSQNILERTYGTKYNISFNEHLFFIYRNLCNQGIIPKDFNGRSRTLEVSLGLFCSIISMAYGALLFTYMTKETSSLPFDSFDSLTYKTNYKVVTLESSTAHIAFTVNYEPSFILIKKSNRLVVVPTIEEMYKLACFSQKEKYAIYQAEEKYKVMQFNTCLMPSVKSLSSWICSGITKNFKYKRTIDMGIIKLMEVGLLNAINNRWLKRQVKLNLNDIPQPIKMDQVSLIIAMACFGVIIALIIFIIENIVFVYKIKNL